MRRLQLAIVGLGRVGRACAQAIAASDDLALAAVVRRPESPLALPSWLSATHVARHIGELPKLGAALVCVPTAHVRETAIGLLQHAIPVVEAATVPVADADAHHQEIHRAAFRHHVAAVTGAGWNPGILPLVCDLFAVLAPKGSTEVRDRPGVSLHHTLAAKSAAGIKDALATEHRLPSGVIQRYVYVELDRDADGERALALIKSDPLFLDEETIVLAVDSIAELESEGHGCLVERLGEAAGKAHQRLLFEARIDRIAVTAETMVAAARALPSLAPGAHSLAEIRPRALVRRAVQR